MLDDPGLAPPEAVRASASNLADLLAQTAERRPDGVALVHEQQRVTWADLDRDVSAVAAGLLAAGLQPGDRVVLVLPTSVAFAQVCLGVLRAGGVAVPLNPALTTGELARTIGRTAPVAVVAAGAAIPRVRQAVAGVADALTNPPAELAHLAVPRLVVDGTALPGESTLADLLAEPDSQRVRPATGGEDPAVMLVTSGASGDPRAAVLSHRALVAALDQLTALQPAPVDEDDVLLGVLPLFHVYGLTALLGQALRTGARLVLVPGFDAARTLAAIADHAVTVAPVVPAMLVAWAQTDEATLRQAFASLRYLVSGAAPLPVHVLEDVAARGGVPVHQGYGLTEGAPVVSTTLASPVNKPGSVGRPVPGVQVMLLDERGDPVDDGDPGEIAIRGASLFSGYVPDHDDAPAPDEWWRTGDVALADAEGDLWLVDRRRDLVIVSGFNVYPREVEEALLEHPDVLEAAVVPVPDPRTGEAVKAVVVPRSGRSVTPEQVAAHCRERLARYKCPTVVEVVETLPRTATGKIAKGRLRATGGVPVAAADGRPDPATHP
jgi:long-chain acyl-CoA synthetase